MKPTWTIPITAWLRQRFELSRATGGKNIRPMEGLRGFAVFLVFMVHFDAFVRPWIANTGSLLAFSSAWQFIGATGVDLFFVLSGYLIYGTLMHRPQAFWPYLGRRIRRLYPTFAAVFALYLVLSYLFPQFSKIPNENPERVVYLLQNLLLLPGIFGIPPVITVAWSLSYEMFYYVVIPLLITGVRLREWNFRWRLAFFGVLALAFAGYCLVEPMRVRLLMFFAGILLFEVLAHTRWNAPGPFWSGLILVCGLLSALLRETPLAMYTVKAGLLFVSFFVVCLACFRKPETGLGRLFTWTPLRWFGNMSYSYFLLHGLALRAGFKAAARILPPDQVGAWIYWPMLPVMFVLSLIPCVALFLLVERPFSLAPACPRTVPASQSMSS